jgi:hypothetical protein
MNYSKSVLVIAFILLQICLQAQHTIKEYYKDFPYKFFEKEKLESGADTTCDEKNAYLHIQSKPNDAWSEYITFTYFKATSGNKIFAVEKGFSTTASDDYKIVFYKIKNGKWENISQRVFPFKFLFKDFWIGKKLPHKKYQQFKVHVEIPPKGVYLIVHIVGVNEMDRDKLLLSEKDLEIYDNLYSPNSKNPFKNIICKWDAKKEVFVKE